MTFFIVALHYFHLTKIEEMLSLDSDVLSLAEANESLAELNLCRS